MGRITGIGWTHATWSPWWGCVEVSPACDFCYAKAISHRFGHDVWGPHAPRRFFGENHWREPFKWDREAEREGKRLRVFPSMCDPFERYSGVSYSDAPGYFGKVAEDTRVLLNRARGDFWHLIESTPNLDWLLTTKRPQEIRKMVPPAWLKNPPKNVWYIVTIESPEYYWRWHVLACIPAVAVRGVSYEPALAPISVGDMVQTGKYPVKPDWMIIGGESGRKARPFDLDTMALPLIEECEELGVHTFFKQTGNNYSSESLDLVNITGKGDKPGEWPAQLLKQEIPGVCL